MKVLRYRIVLSNTFLMQLNWGHGLYRSSQLCKKNLKLKESTAAVLVLPDVILSINPFSDQTICLMKAFSVFFYLLVGAG